MVTRATVCPTWPRLSQRPYTVALAAPIRRNVARSLVVAGELGISLPIEAAETCAHGGLVADGDEGGARATSTNKACLTCQALVEARPAERAR